MARFLEENARTVAVDTLVEWAERRVPIDNLLNLRAARLSPVDRRLARTMVYGVLRQQDTLDAALAAFASHPLDTMPPRLLMTLRVGVFQLAFLSRIPASAAVNATVNTTKRGKRPPWLTGFVNGVLRRAAAERERLSRFAEDEEGLLRCNHPVWLCARWRDLFGEAEMRAICRINNTEPPLVLRVNTRKIGRTDFLALLKKNGIRAESGLFSPVSAVLAGYPGPIQTLAGYESGLFQVQDEGAQLVGLLLARLPGPALILDACAGLGGKTGHLVELAPAGSRIVALDPDRMRLRLLQENLRRLGHSRAVEVLSGRLDQFARKERTARFDAILVDAPCSGTGVIRRQPDIRWVRRPEDLPRYATQQVGLLQQAASLLKPSGLLVYATCSLEPEENTQVLERFLLASPGFALEDALPRLPRTAHKLVRSACLATRPTDGCDGFFAACLRRSAAGT